jgi:hypothetical protein
MSVMAEIPSVDKEVVQYISRCNSLLSAMAEMPSVDKEVRYVKNIN